MTLTVVAERIRQEIASAEAAGESTPGRPTLVKRTGFTDHQVKKALAELVTAGERAGGKLATDGALALAAPGAAGADALAPAGERLVNRSGMRLVRTGDSGAGEPVASDTSAGHGAGEDSPVVRQGAGPGPRQQQPGGSAGAPKTSPGEPATMPPAPTLTTPGEPPLEPAGDKLAITSAGTTSRQKPPPLAQVVAWFGFAFGSVMSIAANVLHTWLPAGNQPPGWSPGIAPQVGAAVWPVALLLSVEALSRVPWRKGKGWGIARFFGVGLVATASALISYGHVRDVLIAWGYGPLAADVGPLSMDGLMVVCGFALLSMSLDKKEAGPK